MRQEATWEAGEVVGSELMRVMEGDSQSQTRSGLAPMPCFSRRLRPVSFRLSLDPDEMRSIFRRRRRYRPSFPQTPSESGCSPQRARLLRLRDFALQIRRENEDCIPTNRATNRTAVGMT